MNRASVSKLHFNIRVDRQAQRFRELIIYVSKQSERDPHFGAVKLNKILYHSDYRAFERFGQPLTGTVYFRLPKGPAPKALIPVTEELLREGAIRVERVPMGRVIQIRTIALRPPVLSHFAEDELFLVDEVIAELWPQTANEVSDASHDLRWRILQNKDSIPYEFALLDGEITSADNARTIALASQLGW